MSECRICIEVLENGYSVEVPDQEEITRRTTAAMKNKTGGSVASVPYMGDATKEYAAKTVKEVLTLVKKALETMTPESEYDSAFAEAADNS